MTTENKIISILDGIRPYLKEDEGDIEFVSFDKTTGVVNVRFLGNCAGCPVSIMTLRAGVERFILDGVPEARRIEQVLS